MNALPKLLSKTKLMRGYQCHKSIYLTVHHKELEPPVTPEQQALFDQGHVVGEEARKRFPGGVLVDNKPWDFFGSLKKTRELLAAQTRVIYEAALEFKGCYARADIITYSEHSGRWTIYEVKSSTKVKEEHLDDVGLQAWIMAKSGLPIEQINIMHINTSCKFPHLKNLFTIEDVTDALRAKYLEITPKVTDIFKVLKNTEIPMVDIGPQCSSPIPCPFQKHCWEERNVPNVSVLNLPNMGDKKWELYKEGIVSLDDDRLNEITPLQKRIVDVYKTKERFIDIPGIKTAISGWTFPLVFLDFETINPAIPRYPQTSPYQQVPFQFSVHLLNSLEGEMKHKEYLHTDSTDPRPQLIPSLIEACGQSGTIVAYFSKFEIARIKELAEGFPEYEKDLVALLDRFVDPLPLLREFVYDDAFHCSFSLKSVAPALLGHEQSYEGMLVANGGDAQRAFEEILSLPVSDPRRQLLVQASLEYCRKDTLVMVDLVKWLFQL